MIWDLGIVIICLTASKVPPLEADYVIRGAMLYDGSGNAGQEADLAIKGDRIAGIGRFDWTGKTTVIDGRGLVVAPGFIDLHTHCDTGTPPITDPAGRANLCYLMQGVVTVVTGNCGTGPLDVADYYAKLEKNRIGTNVLHQVPHNAVRQAVTGNVDRVPTAEEMKKMEALVEHGMKDGAWGLSTGLYYNPGAYSRTEELIELARAAARHGGFYASHMRDEGTGVLASIDEVLTIGREANLPVHISHLKAFGPKTWGKSADEIALILRARQSGLQVTADQYPYIASSTSLLAELVPPVYRQGTPEDFVARLNHPQQGPQMRVAIEQTMTQLKAGRSIRIARFAAKPSWQGKDLVTIAEAEKKPVLDVVLDILKQGGAQIVAFSMSEEDVRLIMKQPFVATASDGSSQVPGDTVPHPRSYGCFPRKIGRFAIEEKLLRLEEAIRSATGLPADILRLPDRGYLKKGFFADVVVFDPKQFRDRATFDKPHQYATGVRYLFVNGQPVISEGIYGGALAGRVLRHPEVTSGTIDELPSVPTISQSLTFKRALAQQISPDGQYVAYEVEETDWTENAFKSEIWIARIETGARHQMTRSKKSSSNPRWSPDSKLIAFLSDRGGKKQIYTISPHGGEAQPLTEFETDIEDFRWAPDGRSIAFTATDPETKAQKDRKETYGEYEIVESDYQRTHLWIVEVPAQRDAKVVKPKRLTDGHKFSVGSFSWSGDGKRLAFDATTNPGFGALDTADIYVLDLVNNSVRKIVDTSGPDSKPVWSPDGTKIAYETSNGSDFFFYSNSYIAVVPADGGRPEILTKDFDEKPRLVAWGPDGIYFTASKKTEYHLSRLDAGKKTIRQVSGPMTPLFSTPSFTKDYRTMAFIQGGPRAYPEVCVSPLSQFTPKPLSALGDQVKPFRLASRELIDWTSKDGTRIEGVLLKPADYNPAKRYPLLVVIHGGPTGIDVPVLAPDRYYPLERFAAKGALILQPNYRGSAGYGERFRSLNIRNLGLGDYDDVITGVDYLIKQGVVDRDRVGAMGWSQGGYISAFIATYSDRFKAVSVGAGISDWMTYYVNTDIHPFTRQYLKATPWDDPEIYRKTSPISYLKTAKTPTLIQHGEKDKRVPIPNAYELYQGLRDRGVPAKLIVYKGFGHGIDKPKQQRAVMEQNYEWFSEWIWGEKPPKRPATRDVKK
jgi:dipeptidyl aminopeptidase/acylaminoacyl peptidase/N-acyl-D-aspartate/D-glutamate deacylase